MLCAQLRRPSYGVRLIRGTQDVSVEQLLEELRSIEVAADRSPYLPADFIRIQSGMQVMRACSRCSSSSYPNPPLTDAFPLQRFIQEGYLARGQCQVRLALPS